MKKLRVKNPLRMKTGESRQNAAMRHYYDRNMLRQQIIAKEDAILAQKQKRAV